MPPKKAIEKKDPAQRLAPSAFATGSSRRTMWTGIPTSSFRTVLGHSISFAKRRNALLLAESIGKDIFMETPLSDWQLYNENLGSLVSMLRSEEETIKKLANTVAKKRAGFRVAYLSRLETHLLKDPAPTSTTSRPSSDAKDSLEPSRPISPLQYDSIEDLRSISPLQESQEPKTPPKSATTTTVPPAPVKLERSGRASRTHIASMLAQHPPGSPGLTDTDRDITQSSW